MAGILFSKVHRPTASVNPQKLADRRLEWINFENARSFANKAVRYYISKNAIDATQVVIGSDNTKVVSLCLDARHKDCAGAAGQMCGWCILSYAWILYESDN